MTPKQSRFVMEYLASGNATQAAIKAGYSPKTAGAIGYENLTKPEIAGFIIETREKLWGEQAMGIAEAVAEMSGLARSNIADFLPITDERDPRRALAGLDRKQLAAIKSVEVEDYLDRRERDADGNVIAREVRRVKITLHDKKGPLDTMFRKHRLLVDRVELAASEDFAVLMEQAASRAEGR